MFYLISKLGWWLLFVCTRRFVCECAYMAWVHTPWRLTLGVSSDLSPLYVLRQVVSLNLMLISSAGLSRELQGYAFLPQPRHWSRSRLGAVTPSCFMWVLGVKTQVLKLVQQAFCWLNHLFGCTNLGVSSVVTQ